MQDVVDNMLDKVDYRLMDNNDVQVHHLIVANNLHIDNIEHEMFYPLI